MFNLPDDYKIGKKMPIKDFVSKDLKPEVRRKIRENVKSFTLSHLIMGNDIPSLVNDEYNCQVVQFLDFELADIKKAAFVANIYQEMIKSPCVIRLFDGNDEAYSFALKRLNQNDKTQVVVTDKLTSATFPKNLPSTAKSAFITELSFHKIINKENKQSFYFELYLRAFILTNDKLYSGASAFLSKPIWYSVGKVRELYTLLCEISTYKEKLSKSISNSEKIQLNQAIRQAIATLEQI